MTNSEPDPKAEPGTAEVSHGPSEGQSYAAWAQEQVVLGVLTGQVPVRDMPIATPTGRRNGKTAAAEAWLAEQEDTEGSV